MADALLVLADGPAFHAPALGAPGEVFGVGVQEAFCRRQPATLEHLRDPCAGGRTIVGDAMYPERMPDPLNDRHRGVE